MANEPTGSTKTVPKLASRGHILVINDAQEVLDVLRALLEEEGFRVSQYSYAVNDLNQIRSVNPDLLILDHLIGDEEYGWQLVQKLRLDRELADLPVIVCTAAVKLVRELEGHLTAKGVTIVLKPFDIDDLLTAVERALQVPGATVEPHATKS
jgi:DNA-binding response OmpR family regulator